MTLTIADQIIQVIEHLAQKFGVVINWSSENIMPIVEQLAGKYIQYEIYTSVMWLILGAIFLVICWIMYGIIARNLISEYGMSDDIIFMTLAFIAVSIPFFILATTQTLDIITCCTFPELKLLDFIQSYVK